MIGKETTTTIIVLCVAMVVLLVAGTISLVGEQKDGVSDLKNVRENWTPGNYSDLWDHNFSFEDGMSFNITIEDYRLYGFPINQSIKLDVRGKDAPALVIEGGATIWREAVKVYEDGSVRQVWVVNKLQPNATFTLTFYGRGQCGRLQEAI